MHVYILKIVSVLFVCISYMCLYFFVDNIEWLACACPVQQLVRFVWHLCSVFICILCCSWSEGVYCFVI